MQANVREVGIFARNLSDGERLGELLFGLIMTLTFTLTAGFVVGESQDAVRELLIATIGCNIAWGIIDGGLLIIGNAFRRGQLALLGQALRQSDKPGQAEAMVAAEIGEMVDPLVAPDDRDDFYRYIARHVRNKPAERTGMRLDDWLGAAVMFVMVVISSVPAALPFVFIDEPWLALRVSNGILLVMLFLIGWRWAGYTTISRWRAGLTMFAFGGLLVAVAIALGG